jgi:thymidylate synthase
MKQYLELIKDILNEGIEKEDRTGVGSVAVFGKQLRFDLSEGFPIITSRRVSLRIAFEETMFFLRGESDTKKLEEKKINIWKGNTTREFLDKKGLTYLPEGDMGKGYGYQWVHWEKYKLSENQGNESGDPRFVVGEVNQVKELLDGLRNDPYGRRHIITAWNPGQLEDMALPPCHLMHMYSVAEGKLHNCFIMRSNDVMYGLPYNIMGYALLNHIFAKFLGLLPGDVVYMGWDAHIYKNQISMAKEQILRDVRSLPQLKINKDLKTFEDILSLEFDDIELIGYNPHPDFKDKPPMAI